MISVSYRESNSSRQLLFTAGSSKRSTASSSYVIYPPARVREISQHHLHLVCMKLFCVCIIVTHFDLREVVAGTVLTLISLIRRREDDTRLWLTDLLPV